MELVKELASVAGIVIGLVTVVLGFIASAMMDFPMLKEGGPPATASSPAPRDVDAAAQKAFAGVASSYNAVVDEMLLTQKNPDYDRLEKRRRELTGFAENLQTQFQGLAQDMQGRLSEVDRLRQRRDNFMASVQGLEERFQDFNGDTQEQLRQIEWLQRTLAALRAGIEQGSPLRSPADEGQEYPLPAPWHLASWER
ncbi:MAG: hypothetical protein HY686_00310 [Chloroflexi bacterium]|nr:hypothetical protein [Chloroflexota bacterium]